MPDLKQQGILNVSLLDMSAHNQAILEFFFNGAGKKTFKLASENQADVFITDFDQPNAKANWEQNYASLGRPAIVLAYKEVYAENAIWLSKPLSSLSMMKASESVKKVLAGAPLPKPPKPIETEASTETSSIPPSSRPALSNPLKHKFVAPKTAAKQAVAHTFKAPNLAVETKLVTETKTANDAEPSDNNSKDEPPVDTAAQKARWKLLCGDYADIQNLKNWQQECVNYVPENYFISSLRDALRLATQSKQMVELKTHDQQMFIMPDVSQIYFTLPLSGKGYVEFCSSPMRKNHVHIHILNTSEAELAKHKANQNKELVSDLEAFVWTSQLLTAQGRLARGVDINRPALLKYWPNMTRVEAIPHMMNIAAVWSDTPNSMVELAKRLDIPQRYVFSFYNAAVTLGLMEQDNNKLKAKARNQDSKPKNRGLFSRLLKRLIGN